MGALIEAGGGDDLSQRRLRVAASVKNVANQVQQFVWVRACVHACVHACVCVCEYVCVNVNVCASRVAGKVDVRRHCAVAPMP